MLDPEFVRRRRERADRHDRLYGCVAKGVMAVVVLLALALSVGASLAVLWLAKQVGIL